MMRMTAVIAGFIVAVMIGLAAHGDTAHARGATATAFSQAVAGTWIGEAHIFVSWTSQKMLPVRLRIAPDGRVIGTIGDATLRNGRLEPNRTEIGRLLHVKTDWIVRGDLDGDVIKAEGIHRDSVSVPLNWVDEHFEGGVNTSGSHFGGKASMWLAAGHLHLDRRDGNPAASSR